MGRNTLTPEREINDLEPRACFIVDPDPMQYSEIISCFYPIQHGSIFNAITGSILDAIQQRAGLDFLLNFLLMIKLTSKSETKRSRSNLDAHESIGLSLTFTRYNQLERQSVKLVA